jgi:undecaprenyl-diphosphatase
VVSSLLFVGLAALAAGQEFLGLDHSIRELVQWERTPLLERPMIEVSRLGQGDALLPLIGAGMLILWRYDRRWTLILPAVMLGAGGLQWVAKWAVNRPRPNMRPEGFPSGHVMIVVVLFGLALYLLWSVTVSRRWQTCGLAVCALAITAVAYSRMYLEFHWLSDVLGGLIGGTAYLLFVLLVIERVRPAARLRRRPLSPAAERFTSV